MEATVVILWRLRPQLPFLDPYEALIGLPSLGLGGLEAFTPGVLWDVFATNTLWAGGLVFAHMLLS